MAVQSHPFADLFPMLAPADAEALRADIAANGLREKIVIFEGKILDGRNRYLALYGFDDRELPPEGDELWLTTFRRFVPVQDGDPLAWVLSKNLHRRHLTDSQRAMVAARLEHFRHGGRRGADDQDANLRLDRQSAAETLHVSERSVNSAAKVRDHGAPELVAKVDAGEVAVSAAAEIATLPVTEQLRILREHHPREFRAIVKEARQETQAEKKAKRQAREEELGRKQQALPAAKFGVILADPEWQFETYSDLGMDRAPDNHYPTSPLEAIKARDIGSLAADDAVLFLWATVPMLPQALEVMAAWGFAYKSHAIWLKDVAGTGYWFRNQHEILLVGTRGNIPAPAMGDQFRSALAWPVGEHSAKPPFAHEIAEAYFPSLPKIELNARTARGGWARWGFEAPGEVASGDLSASSARSHAERRAEAPAESGSRIQPEGTAGASGALAQRHPGKAGGSSDSPAPLSRAEEDAIIRAGYAANRPLAELAAETGLSANVIKGRARKMKLSDRDRQRLIAAGQMQIINARKHSPMPAPEETP